MHMQGREVLKQLLNLKDGKAIYMDSISPKLLHLGAPALAAPQTRILDHGCSHTQEKYKP